MAHKNPEDTKAYQRMRHMRNPWRKIESLIGCPAKTGLAMRAAQGNRCKLCGVGPEHKRNRKLQNLAMDHCHKTNRVRGLLCAACNSAIAGLGDDEEGLLRALRYIREGAS